MLVLPYLSLVRQNHISCAKLDSREATHRLRVKRNDIAETSTGRQLHLREVCIDMKRGSTDKCSTLTTCSKIPA